MKGVTRNANGKSKVPLGDLYLYFKTELRRNLIYWNVTRNAEVLVKD